MGAVENAAPVRVGQEVVECMVDTTRPEPPARGRVVEVCSGCRSARVKITANGHGVEDVPFDRFGHDRPRAHWRPLA